MKNLFFRNHPVVCFFFALVPVLTLFLYINSAQLISPSDSLTSLLSTLGMNKTSSLSIIKHQSSLPSDGEADVYLADGQHAVASFSSGGGMPNYVSGDISVSEGDTPAEKAVVFLEQNKELYGIEEPDAELRAVSEETDNGGRSTVRLSQYYESIAVNGGQLIFHFSPEGKIQTINGNYLSDISLPTTVPTISSEDAIGIARRTFGRKTVDDTPISSELYIHTSRDQAPILTWKVAFRSERDATSMTYLIDVDNGDVIDQYDDIQNELYRDVYKADYTQQETFVFSEGGHSDDAYAQAAYDMAGFVYDYIFEEYGRDSYDNAGSPIISTVRYDTGPGIAAMGGRGHIWYAYNYFPSPPLTMHEYMHSITGPYMSGNSPDKGPFGESFSILFSIPVREVFGASIGTNGSQTTKHMRDYVDGDTNGWGPNQAVINAPTVRVQQKLGVQTTEEIWYLAITQYMPPAARFLDFRYACELAAADLYGWDSSELEVVMRAYAATGIEGDAPVVNSVEPADPVKGGDTTINVTYYDSISGIDTDTVNIRLDNTNLTNCQISDSSATCPVSGLATGNHTISGSVTDYGKNKTTISGNFTVVPADYVHVNPTGTVVSSTAEISATFSPIPAGGIDAEAVTLTLDGVELSGCTRTSDSITCPAVGMAVGSHSIGGSVSDNYGNITPVTGSFSVENTPPVITDIQPSTGLGKDSTTISVSFFDPGHASGINTAAVTVTLDGSTMAGCNVTANAVNCPVNGLSLGQHAIGGTIADNLGNNTAITGSFNVSEDITPPFLARVNPSRDIATSRADISVGFYDPGAGSGINTASAFMTLNGAPISGCTVGVIGINCPVTGLTTGTHVIGGSVADNAGNIAQISGSFNSVADATAPMVFTWPSNMAASNTGINVGIYEPLPTSGINSSSFNVTVDGVRLTTCNNSIGWQILYNTMANQAFMCTADSLAQGDHIIGGSVADAAGNVSQINGSFTVDATPPIVSEVEPANDIQPSFTTITATYTDPGSVSSGIDKSKVILTVDGSRLYGCAISETTISCPANNLGFGSHTIGGSVADMVGNSTAITGSFSRVDLDAPVAFNVQPMGNINSNSVTASAQFYESGSGINLETAQMTIDDIPSDSCTVSYSDIKCSLTDLSTGFHTIGGSVSDNSGNSAPISGSFSVESSPPTVSNIEPVGTIGTNFTIVSADLTDDESGIKADSVGLAVDGITISDCEVTTAHVSCFVSGLLPGEHSILFTLADNAGNPATISGSFSVSALTPGFTSAVSSDAAGAVGDASSNTNAAMTLSADGRYAAFASTASNLVAGDTNAATDVFVKDNASGAVSRISTDSAGAQASGPAGFVSDRPSISADGRYVVFHSSATNLVAGDTNNVADVFMKDTQTGAVTRISTTAAGAQVSSSSDWPSVSADGRYVAFSSWSSGLVAGDTNATTDIFIKDTQSGGVNRVSTDSAGVQASGQSDKPSISADGRYVVFRSVAANLVAGDTLGKWDEFVKDVQTGQSVCLSTGGDGDSGWPSISADGRFVTYPSFATNLVAGDTNGQRDIFLADVASGQITRVSTDSAGNQVSGYCGAPVISADGRYVAFMSVANTLVAGDTGFNDIFRKDTQTGQVLRYSTSSTGAQANGNSDYPAIDASGGYVGFVSNASNLVTGDANGVWDMFVGSKDVPAIFSVEPSGTIYSSDTEISVRYSGQGNRINSEGITITLDGNIITGCTASEIRATCPVAGLVPGIHEIGGSISDIAGNTSSISGTFDLVNDNEAPTLAYSGPFDFHSRSTVITASYMDNEPSVGMDLSTARVNYNGLISPCSAADGTITCEISGLQNGAFSITVTMADKAGNYGETSYVYDGGETVMPIDLIRFIRDDSTGGDCASIGTWDNVTKTCELSTDILGERIVVEGDGITLNGAGHSLFDISGYSGVYIAQRAGVNVRNLQISGFPAAVTLESSTGSIISGIIARTSSAGISLANSNDNILSGNDISDINCRDCPGVSLASSSGNQIDANALSNNDTGIMLLGTSHDNEIKSNSVTDNYYGIRLQNPANGNIISGNLIESNDYLGLLLNNSDFNTIYQNSFISNSALDNGVSNIFSLPLPVGGNYWSDWTIPDADNDGIVDTGYTDRAIDDLPWTTAGGWVDARPPTILDLAPSGSIDSRSTTISATYDDALGANASGINPASVSVTLDGQSLSGCTITTAGASCAVTGLGTGLHSIGGSIADNAGNPATISGSFSVSALTPGFTSAVSSDAAGAVGDASSNTNAPMTLSADGRYAAFASTASNLVAGDTNAATDVFVKDNASGAVSRISTDSAGAQASGPAGFVSDRPSISADGRYVVFHSSATNLVTGDTNNVADVFMKDTQTGAVTRISTTAAGAQVSSSSDWPSVSADGRYVAFSSWSSGLVAGDTNATTDIFIKDTQSGAVIRVSTDSAGVQASGQSDKPSISADGRYVVFRSVAANLVTGDTLGKWDEFVKDVQTDQTVCLSTGGDGDSGWPSISADGRFVTYPSFATNLVAGDTNGQRDIFLADVASGQITRVSTDSAGNQISGYCGAPVISADGRYVAFMSVANSLVAGDTAFNDIFRKDTQTGQVLRYSTSSTGAQANGNSDYPAIDASGGYVGFVSNASNLVTGDANGVWDMFVGSKV